MCFLPVVYLKTLRIVLIFYKDLQEGVIEKHLSGWVVGAPVSGRRLIFFFVPKLFEHRVDGHLWI